MTGSSANLHASEPALSEDAKTQAADNESSLISSVFSGDSELARRMRAFHWEQTPLGPVAGWPQSLRTSISICLASRFPIVLYWGPEYVVLYNDAYSVILGGKHPWALGQSCSVCWREIWDTIGPMLDGVLASGKATWSDDLLLMLRRFGYPEECYFSFSFSPVQVETGSVGGVFTAVIETTEKVIGERRLRTLRDLAARAADARSEQDAWRVAASTLEENPRDVPFAILCEARGDGFEVAATSGINRSHPLCHELCRPGSKLFESALGAVKSSQRRELENLGLLAADLPLGPWERSPNTGLLLPIAALGQGSSGLLLAAASPAKALDESYRTFFELLARQIATSIADARAYDEERKRAESLAELDRAKTLFFSNISHELRTPLTLLLGPTEAALASPDTALKGEELEMVYRNQLRLLKLVNTLLDFSRIEAGRIQATYEPTEISSFTANIASLFRPVMEKAGLAFVISCEAIEEPIYVDREMWEKIVLNLLSNAFKFTFEGQVEISLKEADDSVELAVRDSGVGIAKNELPRIFERFHRVENARARTYEGTGIGLALIQELVKLHGGSVGVESAVGRGSVFRVRIPRGKAHLPADRVQAARGEGSTALAGEIYVDEAETWLPRNSESIAALSPDRSHRDLILVADDNADMRGYLTRILGEHYRVHAVSDGVEAVKATHELRPALVMADVMMPKLDGYGVVAAIRNQESLRGTPVILLSARAGEESRVEGLQAGADDYLVKPFTVRELLARIATHVKMANLRRTVAEREARLRTVAEQERRRLEELLAQAPAAIGLLNGSEHRWIYVNQEYIRLTGRNSPADFLGKPLVESLPELESQGFVDLLDKVYRTGQAYFGREMKTILRRAEKGLPEESYWDFVFQPMRDAEGEVDCILVHAIEVTDKVLAKKAIAESEQRFRAIVETTPECVKLIAPDGILLHMNNAGLAMLGADRAEALVGKSIYDVIAPEDRERFRNFHQRICAGERGFLAYNIVGLTGVRRRVETHSAPLASGGVTVQLAVSRDVTQRQIGERALRDSEARFRALVNASSNLVYRMSPDWREMRQLDGRDFIATTQEPREDWLQVYVHREDQAAVLEAIERAIETKSPLELEHRVWRLDGRLAWISSRAVPLVDKDGEILEWFGAASDVTARKSAEGARRHLAAIVESSDDAIISKDLNGIVTSWNRQAERLFGYTEQEMIGRPILTIIPPELHHDEDMILGKIRSGQKIDHFETVRVSKFGERIDVSLSISPVRDDQGKIVGAAKIARDIRENKKIERALRTTEKLAAAGRLAATVAHEINNPLEAVTNLVYLAKRDLPDREKVTWHLNSAKRELDRITHIARQTLGFYRDTSSPIRFNVSQLIDDLLLLYERRLETRDIKVVKQYDRDAELVALAGEVRQAFSNLLTNAMDAMPEGGTVAIRVRKRHEWRPDERPGVRITIADSGSGIAPKDKPNVFQPFFTTKADVGTGLGLWITRSIIEKHGGSIHVKSRAGTEHGTSFSIFLPSEPNRAISESTNSASRESSARAVSR